MVGRRVGGISECTQISEKAKGFVCILKRALRTCEALRQHIDRHFAVSESCASVSLHFFFRLFSFLFLDSIGGFQE